MEAFYRRCMSWLYMFLNVFEASVNSGTWQCDNGCGFQACDHLELGAGIRNHAATHVPAANLIDMQFVSGLFFELVAPDLYQTASV